MSSPRLRRLQSDYDALKTRFEKSPFIRVKDARGNPPEKYVVEFSVRGLEFQPDGTIVERTNHVAEINLTTGYPRQSPQCKMLTPIFHPNFDPSTICIGDHWAASESLADLICRIGEMITYQSYNTGSPRNGEAARWANENAHLLPLDRIDFYPAERTGDEPVMGLLPGTVIPDRKARQCANCWAEGPGAGLQEIAEGEFCCKDCLDECLLCGKPTTISTMCPECAKIEADRLFQAGKFLDNCAFRECEELLEAVPSKGKTLAASHLLVRCKEKKQKIAYLLEGINKELPQKRFFEADRLMTELMSMGFVHPQIEQRLPRVRRHVREADEFLKDLPDLLRSAPRKALRVCEKALVACPDHPKARNGLNEAKEQITILSARSELLLNELRPLLFSPHEFTDRYELARQKVAELRGIETLRGTRFAILNQAEERLGIWKNEILENIRVIEEKTSGSIRVYLGILCAAICAVLAIGSIPGAPSEIVALVVQADLPEYSAYLLPVIVLLGLIAGQLTLSGVRAKFRHRRLLKDLYNSVREKRLQGDL